MQVNLAIQQLDQVIQSNVASAEQLASTAEELTGQAENLECSMQFFKTGQATPDTAKPETEQTGERPVQEDDDPGIPEPACVLYSVQGSPQKGNGHHRTNGYRLALDAIRQGRYELDSDFERY